MVHPSTHSGVGGRLRAVRDRIAASATSAGRDPDSITLVAVSKRKPASDILAAYEAGQRDFGENYVQEFASKASALPDLPGARFHMIGHLQSNNAKPATGLFTAVHTVHNAKIVRRLDRFASSNGTALDVFLEVKLSHEKTKSGMDESMVAAVLDAARAAGSIRPVGLMTMPPWSADPEQSRAYFRRLRSLAAQHGLRGLSMGMSHDLEVAIEEGATHVRVGTAIFGKRDPLRA